MKKIAGSCNFTLEQLFPQVGYVTKRSSNETGKDPPIKKSMAISETSGSYKDETT